MSAKLDGLVAGTQESWGLSGKPEGGVVIRELFWTPTPHCALAEKQVWYPSVPRQ